MRISEDDSCCDLSRFAMVGVPSSAGARQTGQERAPAALRAAGLLKRLGEAGLEVADLGDLPSVPFRADDEHPKRRNLESVLAVARQVADRVRVALENARRPLVLGGDCTVSLGVVAALLRHQPRLGLVYFDGDVDLNTPETTRSGIFDGMVLAHLIGRGAPELAGFGPRRPLLAEEDIVLFGYDRDSGWIDPPELELLERSRFSSYPLARVRSEPEAAAREARGYLESRFDAFLVHFDVDVMNLPSADVPHPRGLEPNAAFEALRVFMSSPACVSLVVAEHNVELDPDGVCAETLVRGLTSAVATSEAR